MKKIFTKNLFIYMLLAMLVAVLAIFGLQTFITKRNNTTAGREKLETVKEKLESNKQEIEQLTESMGENSLAKTMAFADLIASDPDMINELSPIVPLMSMSGLIWEAVSSLPPFWNCWINRMR